MLPFVLFVVISPLACLRLASEQYLSLRGEFVEISSRIRNPRMMEIQFLGTSAGTPTKTRNVSALAIRSLDSRSWYLVDCGEGTQHRILHTRLSLRSLGAIFITHVHGDHCYGLPGLLASAGMHKRTDELSIIGPLAIQGFIKGVLDTTRP
ncbi:MAG TPA: MBL fold metallo-hydrolase, partial [Noviherbaspirillum sp.]